MSECRISYEIDKIYLFFANNFSLYLRMCIFYCTFVAKLGSWGFSIQERLELLKHKTF